MDPNVLRVLTDPEARKDPAQLRAAMAEMGNDSRRAVLEAVRINSLVMGGLGYVLLVGGVVMGAASLVQWLPRSTLIGLPLLGAMGGLFIFLARYTALPSSRLLKHGTLQHATVLEVKALGRSIGIEKPGISATLSQITVVLSVPALGPAGARIEHRQFILGGDLALLQVGSSVSVRCDPQRPTQLAFDFDAA
jgi:hypothetical protein